MKKELVSMSNAGDVRALINEVLAPFNGKVTRLKRQTNGSNGWDVDFVARDKTYVTCLIDLHASEDRAGDVRSAVEMGMGIF